MSQPGVPLAGGVQGAAAPAARRAPQEAHPARSVTDEQQVLVWTEEQFQKISVAAAETALERDESLKNILQAPAVGGAATALAKITQGEGDVAQLARAAKQSGLCADDLQHASRFMEMTCTPGSVGGQLVALCRQPLTARHCCHS